jgi:hypothetical protein
VFSPDVVDIVADYLTLSKDMKEKTWTRVNRSAPCLICGKPDYCTRSSDLALCMRVESERPSACRLGGWIHRLCDPPPLKKPPPPTPPPDFSLLAAMLQSQAAPHLDAFAHSLSLPRSSLEALGVGAGFDREWWSAWPERTPSGAICGIKKRFPNGAKWYVKGSSPGLYFDPQMEPRPSTIFIPEGGTDTAALISMGMNAVGRPSALGGQRMLIEKLRSLKPGRVVVLGERDEDPTRRGDPKVPSCPISCQGCQHCSPGTTAALSLVRALRPFLHCPISAALPGAKDTRAWMMYGGKASEWVDSLSPLGMARK